MNKQTNQNRVQQANKHKQERQTYTDTEIETFVHSERA